MGTKHTPTPYSIGLRTNFYKADGSPHEVALLNKIGRIRFEAISIGTESGQICLVPLDESSRENAAFIVRACNEYYENKRKADLHDELVKCVENMRYSFVKLQPDTTVDNRIRKASIMQADQALTKARGEA